MCIIKQGGVAQPVFLMRFCEFFCLWDVFCIEMFDDEGNLWVGFFKGFEQIIINNCTKN